MPENNELVNMLRTVIQEEMQSVRQEVRTIVQEELKPVNEKLITMDGRLAALETGQQGIEATVNDIRSTNRETHKDVISRLDYIVEDLKRLEPHEEKAVR
jgi:TRAP-type C4-dicarboxylate transport system substrate-binding protein